MVTTSKIFFFLCAIVLGLGITEVDARMAGDRRGVRLFAESVDTAAEQTSGESKQELQKISNSAWAIYKQMLNSNSQAEHTRLKDQMPALRVQLVEYISNVVEKRASQTSAEHAAIFNNLANAARAKHTQMYVIDRNQQAVLARESLALFGEFTRLHNTLPQPTTGGSSTSSSSSDKTNADSNEFSNGENSADSIKNNSTNDSNTSGKGDSHENVDTNATGKTNTNANTNQNTNTNGNAHNTDGDRSQTLPAYTDVDRPFYPVVSRRIAMIVPRILENIEDVNVLGDFAITENKDVVSQKTATKYVLSFRKLIPHLNKPLFVVDLGFFDNAEAIDQLRAMVISIIEAGGQVAAIDSGTGVEILPENKDYPFHVINNETANQKFNRTLVSNKTMLLLGADYLIVREPDLTFESAMQQIGTPVFYTAQEAISSLTDIRTMLLIDFKQTTIDVAYFDPQNTPLKPAITFSSSIHDPRNVELFGSFAVNPDASNLKQAQNKAKVTLYARKLIPNHRLSLFIAYASAFTDPRALGKLHDMALTISALGGQLVIIDADPKAFAGIENVSVIKSRKSLEGISRGTNISEETFLRFAADYAIIPIPNSITTEEMQHSNVRLFGSVEETMQ